MIIKKTIFIFLFALLCVSCSMLNTPVRDFFENSEMYNNRDINADSNKDGDDDNNGDTNIDDDGGDDSGGESETTVSGVFYVSATGKSDATGTKTDPFDSFDKAFTALKNSLETDTTLTSGKIYLTSNIEITEEIDLSAYAFADIGRVCEITIAGDGEKRTIDAKSNCRVLQIGYTNGNVTVENLILTGGKTTDGQGGGGLFISSNNPSSGTKVTVKNCDIKNNESIPYNAGGVYLKTGYSVIFSDCEISNNKSAGIGAAGIEVEQIGSLEIKSTIIKDNEVDVTGLTESQLDFGTAININHVMDISDVTITGNTASGVSGSTLGSIGAIRPNSYINISGKNTIYDNVINSVQRNIVLDSLIIVANGDLPESKIGVLWTGTAPTMTSQVKFAGGITDSNVTSFISDCEYLIIKSGSYAAFGTSGSSGSITDLLGATVTFSVSPATITSGQNATLTVTPTIRNSNGFDITENVQDDISWNLTLYAGSSVVKSSSSSTLTLSDEQTLPENYTLFITATLYGMSYDDSVTVECQ